MRVRMPGADPAKASEPGGLLAEGKYLFRVSWAEERKSKKKMVDGEEVGGDPQVLLECDPLMRADGAEFEHAMVTDFITFIEKTKNLNAHKLKILGQAPGDWSDFDVDVPALKGGLFIANVSHSVSGTKTFANVRYWESLEDAGIDRKQWEEGEKQAASDGFGNQSVPSESLGSDEVPF